MLLKHVFAQSGLDSSKSQRQPEFPGDVAEALPGCQAVQRHLSQRGVTRNAMHKQPLVLGSQLPRTSCGMVQPCLGVITVFGAALLDIHGGGGT